MANFVFNNAKGRIVELYKRVDTNSPAGCVLVLIPLSASDTASNAQDADTVTAALATAMNEQTGGGWVRKDLADAQLAELPAAEDTGNTYDVYLPAVTWTAPTAASDTTGLLVCYDESGSDADGVMVPLTHHDFAVTADGNDVILNLSMFFSAA